MKSDVMISNYDNKLRLFAICFSTVVISIKEFFHSIFVVIPLLDFDIFMLRNYKPLG